MLAPVGERAAPISLADTPAVPEWIHLLPSGKFSGEDGRGPYQVGDATELIRTSLATGKLPVDENHATDLGAVSGAASPARGWITAMEARPDGIWGRVDWTPAGRQLLQDHAYRHISPTFEHSPRDGRVVRILRAALTNLPNLPQLTALHSRLDVQRGGPSSLSEANVNLSPTDRAVCERMGFSPRAFSEHKAGTIGQIVTLHTGRPADGAYGLTAEQRDVCSRMGLDQKAYAAHLAGASGNQTVAFSFPSSNPTQPAAAPGTDELGLTPKERQFCASIKMDPADFASLKAAGNTDGLGLTLEERAICKKYGQDPKVYAEQKRNPRGHRPIDGVSTA